MTSRIVLALALVWLLVACSPRAGGDDTAASSPSSVGAAPAATIASSTTTLAPAPTGSVVPSLRQTFEVVGDPLASVLSPPLLDDFEGRLNAIGAVVYHDGLFHLFYDDIQGGWPPDEILVGYATSEDGISFERVGGPLLSSGEVPFAEGYVGADSVIVEPDGTWTMYFGTDTGVIGRASAAEPGGPWLVHPDPVLEPGDGWDRRGVGGAAVVRDGLEYLLYYNSATTDDANPRVAVGAATSLDGVEWTKLPGPVFEGSASESGFDSYKTEVAEVIGVDGGYIMAYRADDGRRSNWGGETGYGLALSQDGLSWRRFQEEPVISENDVSAWATLWSAALVDAGGELLMWVETDGPPIFGTRINALRWSGDRLAP